LRIVAKPPKKAIGGGEPLWVGRDDDLDAVSRELRERMLAADEEAWAALGKERP